MTAASQEMADLLREVQKLQKELQPVRSAVAALQKRESETPNPAAAGASLHKVASRLETVRLKYEPFLTRLQELLSDEVPAFLQQTPLLAVGEEGFNEVKATDAAYDTAAANASLAPAAARSLNRSTAGDTGPQAAQHAQAEDAARLLREVCPPATPHLLRPENLRFIQQQLRLRAEMVEYLIATNRLVIADHVAQSYGLPRQWFPRLVALHRERSCSTSNAVVVAAASPLVTPAIRPRTSAAGGVVPPQSPIQLPPPVAPARAVGGSSVSTPIADARSPAGTSASVTSEPFTALPAPTVIRLPPRDKQSPPTRPSPARSSAVAEEANGTTDDAATSLMPDLVARVVSAAMYLKDDYMDRMVLERTLEQSAGLVSASFPLPPSSSQSPAAESLPATPQEQYKACVVSRIGNIPRHHLHTQSGDPVFDGAMMNVIEDLLVYGLQRWAEDDTGMPDAVADAQRGSDAAETLAAETKKRKAALLRNLTTDTFLTAEEMLLADKVWNEDILSLKRPTRFYCVETGLSTDEFAGLDGTAPRARATGEVISQLVAEASGSLASSTGIFIT